MAKQYNSSEMIYEYLKGETKSNVRISKLPPAIQRQLVTTAVQRMSGGIQRNLNVTKGTILDQELYNNKPPHEVPNTRTEEQHTLIINDIYFSLLPSQIGIQYQTHSFKSTSIRSQGPVKTKSGRGIIWIQLQLIFVGVDEINTKLRRLIAQARILPIWYIDNELIRSHVYPEDNQFGSKKSIGVVLNAMSITTHPEAVETLVATLSLEVFNWEVYSRDFSFIGTPKLDFIGKTGLNNLMSDISVYEPRLSGLFTQYWDTILSGESQFAGKAIKKIEETMQSSSPLSSIPMYLYKTQDSYSFPQITNLGSDDAMSLIYSSYQVIPTEVVQQLVTSVKEDTKTTSAAAKQDAINLARARSELGIIPTTTLTVQTFDQTVNGATYSDPIVNPEQSLIFNKADIIEYATSGRFIGKKYVNDPNNRDREDVFDCSSYVYNVLKKFGILLGTYTGSQLANIRSRGADPILTGTANDLWYFNAGLSKIQNEDYSGCLIFCFRNPKGNLQELEKEGRIFQTRAGRKQVGHVGFITSHTYASDKKGIYRNLKITHAINPVLSTTGLTAVDAYDYFEVYPIPGINYSKNPTKQISQKLKDVVKKIIENPKNKNIVSDFNPNILSSSSPPPKKGDGNVELFEASKRFGEKLVKALNAWLSRAGKDWKLVWLRNGTFLLEKKNTFVINNKAVYTSADNQNLRSGPVLEHVAVSINNTFARIPMNGHELVTHQYLGGGDLDMILHLKVIGTQFLTQLQMIRKYTEASARTFRYLDDVGTIEVKNVIAQLCGAKKFIIESIESKTNPDSPELYDVSIHLSEMRNNPRDTEAFKQEFVRTTDQQNAFIERLFKYGKVMPDYYDLQVSLSSSNEKILRWKMFFTIKEMTDVDGDVPSSVLLQKYNMTHGGYALHEAVSSAHISRVKQQKAFIDTKTREELLRRLMFAVTTDLLGYASPLFQLLGITEEDLKGVDSTHPLYAFNIFNNFSVEYLDDPLKFKSYAFEDLDTLQLKTLEIPGVSSGDSRLFVLKKIGGKILEQGKVYTDRLFDDLIIKRKFLLEIPFSEGIVGALTDSYSSLVEMFRSLTIDGTLMVAGWFSALELPKLIGAQTVGILDKVTGTEIAKATKLLAKYSMDSKTQTLEAETFRTPTNDPAVQINTTVSVTLNSTSYLKIQELQAKARFALVALFSQYRSIMKRIGELGLNSLKYTEKFADLIKIGTNEDIVFAGLPAYQDIPVPYLNLSGPEFKDVQQKMIQNNMQTIHFFNPDFYFFNAGDNEEMDGKRITDALTQAQRSMQSNYILSHGFGLLPSKDGAFYGQFAKAGNNDPNSTHKPSPKNQVIGNNLPDDLMNYYLPMVAGRTTSSLAGFDGKEGFTYGYAGSQTALGVEDTKNGKHTFNLLNPALQSVHFGPVGGIESRLATMIDRSPARSISLYANSLFSKHSSPHRIRRAMPAIKLYFIEDDTSGLGGTDPSSYIRSFDDFFSYKAIKELKMISSRKFPATHLILRLSNLYGNMDSLQFSDANDASYDPVTKTSEQTIEQVSFEKQNTTSENPFTRFILKEGIRVQLKGGFENNPTLMKEVFNGQIVQINQESGDEVVIVCQDFGTQLVADIKGPDKASLNSHWIDTFDLLSWLITQPEMTYFGRWTLDVVKSVGESRSTGGWEKYFKFLADPRDDNMFCPTREQMVSVFSDETAGVFSALFWALKNRALAYTPLGQNVSANGVSVTPVANVAGRTFFAITASQPSVKGNTGGTTTLPIPTVGVAQNKVGVWEYKLGDFGYRGLDYTIYRQTIWDIFKEMELRHPGWIGHPVPYGNRMTMFFGQPTQLYWHRPPSPIESAAIYKQNQIVQKELAGDKEYQKVLKALQGQQSKAAANYVANKVKEYAWAVFDWGMLAATVYTGLTTGGLGTAGTTAAKLTIKQVVKGVAAGLIAYGALRTGNGTLTSVLGAGVLAYGIGSARVGLTEIVKLGGRYSTARKVIAGSLAVGAGTGLAAGLVEAFNNVSGLVLLESKMRQNIAQATLTKSLSGRLKPFRDYHIVTSKNHIVANQIKSSVHNIYNAVTLEYTKDDSNKLGNGDVIKSSQARDSKIVRASHRILDKDLKMGFFSFPNCRGSWMADRYAQGLLLRYMKDAYQGQLIVLGDFDYKPYDRVLIEDDYLGMYGQIEIEQVVHTMSPEIGFLTEITPDLVMYGNTIVDMVYDNYMSVYRAWRKMSWTDSIEAVLKNDPQKFFDKMGAKQDSAGVIRGAGTAEGQNSTGFSQTEARLLNSAPTLAALFGLGVLTGIGTLSTTALGVTAGGAGGALLAGGSAAAGANENKLNTADGGSDTVGNLASYIGYKLFGSLALKFYEWSSSRQPVLFEPLYINGRPMLPTIDFDKVSMVQNIQDQFIPVVGNLARGFNVLQESGRMFVYGQLNDKLNALPTQQ